MALLHGQWKQQARGHDRRRLSRDPPHYLGVAVDEYVLDFACREMEDADLLRQLPDDKRIAAGVIDVRTLEIEHPRAGRRAHPQGPAHRRRPRHRPPPTAASRSSPRTCAREKLRALVEGTRIVRREL
ncbi:MAG: hypothetical protein HS111_18070 [Kofleriaceae bacterium]|nr:hypothetical protein [Kofleriaceae bacterium]